MMRMSYLYLVISAGESAFDFRVTSTPLNKTQGILRIFDFNGKHQVGSKHERKGTFEDFLRGACS